VGGGGDEIHAGSTVIGAQPLDRTATLATMSTVEAPPVPGLAMRSFRGPQDYPVMLRVIESSKTADGVERSDTVEQIAANYEHLERCDPRSDMLFVEIDGTTVGYTRVWWDQEVDGPLVYSHLCFLDPAWRGRGLGRLMLEWNERRLREIAAGQPDGEKVLQVWVEDQAAGVRALFEACGYEPVTFGAEMVRSSVADLPDCPLPEGVEIQPVAPEHLRAIWEADSEAFRDHWGYVAPTEKGFEQFLAFPHHDPSLWRIAWAGDRVVGQVRSFIDPNENAEYHRLRGWTEFISTARQWRRRGVARALIVESIRALADRGMSEVALGVHTENPNGAFDLYLGLGYEVVHTSTTYRKPL
jgi:mycothiol synthase